MQDKRRIAFWGRKYGNSHDQRFNQSGYSADLITAVNRTLKKTKPSKPFRHSNRD